MGLNFLEIKKNTSEIAEKDVELKEFYKQTTVYINAGGRGTRLEPVVQKGEHGITKALLRFDGDTLIEKHIKLLSKFNFGGIIVGGGDHLNLTQYLQQQDLENVIIDNTEKQEDTGGDLIKAIRKYNCGKNILVENVDTILLVDNFDKLLKQHNETNALGTIVLTTKKGVPNEGAFYVDENGKVIFSREARNQSSVKEPNNWTGFRGSSTGAVIFSTDFLKQYNWKAGDGRLSIYKDLVPELIEMGGLYAYDNENNFFMDVGTPDKYKQIKRHPKIFGAVGARYLKNNNNYDDKQKK